MPSKLDDKKHIESLTSNHYSCIETALNIIGDKWTALLLKQLVSSPKRFSELQKQMIGISPRTLSQRLTHLEQNNILAKIESNESPNCIKYKLTNKGLALCPVLDAMSEWGARYLKNCD